MALDIASINETVGSRKAVASWEESAERREYTRVFLVVANETVTDMNELIDLAGDNSYGGEPYQEIPEMGQEYPSDPNATVHVIEPQEKDEGYLTFHIFVHYRQPDAGGQNPDPTDNDWVISTDFEPFQKIVENETTFDGGGNPNGKPIENSARDPFFDPVTETYYRLVIHASKWFNDWDLAIQAQRQGAMNDANLLFLGQIFPPHTLRCTRWTTSGKQILETGEFYQLNATFVYKPVFSVESKGNQVEIAGWDRAVLDLGFNRLNANGLKVPIQTRGGTAQVPYKLDGNGRFDPDDVQTVFLEFQTVYEEDMSTWGLPDTMP